MGLDMYLYRNTYVKNWKHNKTNFEVLVKKDGVVIDVGNVSYVKTEIMYWRKANAIHDWFVENCQKGVDDCREAYVTTEQLQELLTIINNVLVDPTKANELLPTRQGFFFGGTEYSEYYFDVLRQTKEELELILQQNKQGLENNIFYEYSYHSSW
jgi:hypothetical protein